MNIAYTISMTKLTMQHFKINRADNKLEVLRILVLPEITNHWCLT